MVGRERERARLLEAFERALADRSCELVTILGAAGVGKSRLVQEFVDGLEGRRWSPRGAACPTGRASRSGRSSRRSRTWPGWTTPSRPRPARARIAALLEGEPDGELVARAVAGAVGLGAPAGRERRALRGRPRVLRGGCAPAAARPGLRRHPLGRADVPRPRRPSGRARARRPAARRLRRQARAPRGAAGVGRRQAERRRRRCSSRSRRASAAG